MFKLQYCEDGVVVGTVRETDETPLLFSTKEEAKAWLAESMIEALLENC
jgi:hypothetical protein